MMVGWLYRRLYEIKYINGKICQAKATNLYCMTDIIYIIYCDFNVYYNHYDTSNTYYY